MPGRVPRPRRYRCGVKRPTTRGLIVVALAFAVLDVVLYLLGPKTTGWAGAAAHLTINLVVDASLCLLARYPVGVALLAVAGALTMLGSDLFAPGLLVPEDALTMRSAPTATPAIVANIGLLLDRRRALILTGMLMVLAARPWAPSWEITPTGLLNTALPLAIVLYLDARKQLVRSLRDRAERAEREQHLLAEQARAQERRRLAAEMHDVVTHRLSLIVLHAGALGVTTTDAAVRTAVEEIRLAGTQALDELRDLVGVLREGGAEPGAGARGAGSAAAADPAVLVAESRAVGIPVDLVTEGDPGSLSPTVTRTAYRVVQEALTNVRKHAPGARVRVGLRYGAEGVRIEVANTTSERPPDPVLAGRGSGAGLPGLRQRVELIGGSLAAGPVAGAGGYRLDAILPAYVPTAESKDQDDPGGRGR
ncbi:signal transduction histidine kinase [Amycolatopsis cihanbeyliensis]|uniref:histidine kinase n=1 Tax=Amycolatopsis cihanbeyliensis TaxID=1128664 RepID=A0A542CT97_AMYCI|nr:signal transduction histidine kinase [Amycolatopsis cihanbeyliensis]